MRTRAIILVSCFIFLTGLTVIRGTDNWVFRSSKNRARSAIEIWPTTGTLPQQHALAEIVWYRKAYQNGAYERFNISAMTDNEPMYRFGVERGKGINDKHRPIWFCFERPESEIGQLAYCPLRIDPAQGVLICDQNQNCQKMGG